jgi:manganese efflux pump family protein
MAVVAFVTWLLTAACGLGLVSIWIIEHDGDGPRSRLPKTAVGAHVVLAVAGLTVWAMFLLLHTSRLAWTTVGILVVVAALGFAMVTRYIGVYRAHRARSSVFVMADIEGVSIEPPAPPERRLPVALVIVHGILAVITLLLTLLTALDVVGG